MATKIFWNKAEIAALRERLENEFMHEPLMRRELALQKAQNVLEVDRRRKLHPSAVYRYRKMVEEARAAAAARRKTPSPAPIAPQAPPTPTPAPVASPDLLRAVLDPIFDVLVEKIVRRLVVEIADAAPAVVRVKHNPEPPQTQRAPRVGVLVIGLLPSQMAVIDGVFPNLELTCLTSEEALKRDPLRRAHTVLMTKFISHSVQDRYRKAQNLHLCNGGVSELTEILAKIQ